MIKHDRGLIPAIVCGLLAGVCLVALSSPMPLPIAYLELPGLAVLGSYALLSVFALVFITAAAMYAIDWLLWQHVRRGERMAEVKRHLADAKTLTQINRLVEGLARLDKHALSIVRSYELVDVYGEYQAAMDELSKPESELAISITTPSDDQEMANLRKAIYQQAVESGGDLPARRDLSAKERRAYDWIVDQLGPLVRPASGPQPAHIRDLNKAMEKMR